MSSKTGKKKKKSKKSKVLKTQEDLVDFDSWFWFQEKAGKIRNTQKSEIKVFFEKKGLKNKELRSKFDETVKLY